MAAGPAVRPDAQASSGKDPAWIGYLATLAANIRASARRHSTAILGFALSEAAGRFSHHASRQLD